MQIVHALEQAPDSFSKSIFLVGPTPRDAETQSWRPDMIRALEQAGYDGVVFSPERRNIVSADYVDQTEWEKRHLEMADVILAWVPRSPKMPAFTTNVEFGRYISSRKLIYGRPPESPKNRYLDWMYRDFHNEPFQTVEAIAQKAVEMTGVGAERKGGERFIPLQIWNTPHFAKWYYSHANIGNRIDDAKVLWSFAVPKTNFLFSFVLWTKIWIESEQRHKENEFLFCRTDISTVVPYWLNLESNQLLDTKIVLIEEFRTPVRNSQGKVLELPGGSSFKPENVLQVASDELFEETGIRIAADRFRSIQDRQICATVSTHHAALFAVSLTDEEIAAAEVTAREKKVFGLEESSERTTLKVVTLRELLLTDQCDWSMLGMILNGVAKHECAHQ